MIKNIIIASDYAFYQGGAANVAIETAIALAQNSDFNIYFFAGNGKPCDDLLENRIKIVALNYPDLLGNPNKIDAFCKGIYNFDVERRFKKEYGNLNLNETIVHIHTWTKVLTSAVFSAAKTLGLRIFLTVHEYFLACPNGACYNYVKNEICELPPMSFQCICSNCDARNYLHKLWRCIRQKKQNGIIRNNKNINYIFISQHQKKQLIKRIPVPEHQYIVQNPIPVENSFQVEAWENDIYLYIGRLSKEKGPHIFCQAITDAGVKGIVIGNGLMLDELKKAYPNLTFTGWLDKSEIDKYLMNTRALVFPSQWYEGSPLTVPEVQAHGIPCIVTNCSSAVDDINNGVNGEIVGKDTKSIVEAINRFSDDKYVKKLSQRTYSDFNVERRSEKRYATSLIDLYNNVVNNAK